MRIFRNIPCIIETRDDLGHRVILANTMTYWGAKRLKKTMEMHAPQRTYTIHEIWHHPYLRTPDPW